MRCSWEADAKKFTPELRVSVAFAENRAKAFKTEADLYVTNIDAATWLAKEKGVLAQFEGGLLVIDEATSTKRATSQRSKAVKKMIDIFERRILMSGTPAPNTVLDLWHQYYLLDKGERLGSSWYGFRNAACSPVATGPGGTFEKWIDKPGVHEAVGDLVADITIRHTLEQVIDMPEQIVTSYEIDLTSGVRDAYRELRANSLLQVEGQQVSALNAAALVNKLLQTLSGAVYSADGTPAIIENGRTELVMDLVEQRRHSLVAFQWRHQRDALVLEARKRGIEFAVIDGETSGEDRGRIVDQMQDGLLQVVFCQPASIAHGATLTRATTVIWASPTYNYEHYLQFNRRIYRAGQTRRTEVIHLCARGTQEKAVYEALERKHDAMKLLLDLLSGETEGG